MGLRVVRCRPVTNSWLSNWTPASRSSNFVITRMITDWIGLHSASYYHYKLLTYYRQVNTFDVITMSKRQQNAPRYLIFVSPGLSLTARPKSPSLSSMSALIKKFPTLMSRWMTRCEWRYAHAWTAWCMKKRTSGSVSLPLFFNICTRL